MAEQPLKKPPGYRNPGIPVHSSTRPPPRKLALPSSFHTKKKKRRSCCRVCYCFIFVLILILILFLAVALGIFYLWFEPKLPVFHLQSLRFPQFNVTVKPDGTYLDAKTVTRIEVKNPNGKLSLFYESSHLAVTVGDDTDLGSKVVPGFSQGKRNTTSLKFETSVKNLLVDDGVGTKLKNQFRSKDLVVNVVVRSKLGFTVAGLRFGPLGFKVLCGGVSIKKLESGDMPECTINTLKWINIH